MINLAELEQYFPEPNKPVTEGPYTFRISLGQDTEEEIFIVNLKIKQSDTKEDHLIKFRLGLGKDKESNSKTHETHKPHFEIDIYKREKDSFSATIYFTFEEANDEQIMEYAKGTVVVISRIIDIFIENHHLTKKLIEKLVYEKEVLSDLSAFEPILIKALYDCYKNSDLVVRQNGDVITIKTEHNLSKYLNIEDLEPLYLPLLKLLNSKSPKGLGNPKNFQSKIKRAK